MARFALFAAGLPKQVTSGIFISCTTTADRNQQINDALMSGNPTSVTDALHAGLQQNADTLDDAYAECAG